MTDRSMKERAVTWIINRVMNATNRRVGIAELQRRHNANEGRVFAMRLTDLGREWHFRVWQGRLEYVTEPRDVHGGFRTTSDVVLALARGKRRWMDPATGEEFERPYMPIDALTHGDIGLWGEAATNDALLFARAVYREAWPQLRGELGAVQEGAARA